MSLSERVTPSVLIIGAGPAGLASAYALRQRGIAFALVERSQRVGDTWASVYPSLRLNTTRFYSHMPDMRFPLGYGIFASGAQYHQYLQAYAAKHRFPIQFERAVQRVSRASDGIHWQVSYADGATEYYPAVISATGVFGNPSLPHIEGMDSYQGTLIHAHDYRHTEQLRGRRVLVVGTGPSGVDIAVAAAQVAHSTAIAIRSGIDLRRRYPLGLPQQMWLMLALNLPRRTCHALMRTVGKRGFPEQARYGLARPQQGGLTAYQGRELLDLAKAGKVTPVRAPVRFHPHSIELDDGTFNDADMVIMATGYEPVLHQYLDVPMQFSQSAWQAPAPCDWEIGPNGQRGFPLLDRSQHPNGRQVLGQAGLYIVGVYYKGKGALYNMPLEARIASQQIADYLARME